METNESIIARDIVSLGDRKIVGKVKGLTVDCESMAVDHYLANSASTASSLVLPFEKALGVGDAFMTIQTKEDFYGADSAEAKKVEKEAYRLIEASVFSRGGNSLGKVKSYEYDTTFGTVTEIVLDNDQTFVAETFMFFTPEFVFVDDGVEIEYDLRQKNPAPEVDDVVVEETVVEIVPEDGDAALEAIEDEALQEEELRVEIAEEAEGSEDVEDTEETEEEAAEEAEDAEGAEEAEAAEETEDAGADEEAAGSDEAELMEFLEGLPLNADVASTDGEFKAEKGTVLTKGIVEEAAKHDALLKLTMCVDA